jgi:hypothetical protein
MILYKHLLGMSNDLFSLAQQRPWFNRAMHEDKTEIGQ